MKNKILVFSLLFIFSSVGVFANVSNNVDKFVPSKGVKVRENSFANKLDNMVRNSSQKNKETMKNKQYEKQQQKQSYGWT